MNELTPRDDIKKTVSEILKRVDRLIRAGEIDQAMREIIQAKEIDPKNVYIFAYEERITYLKEEHEKHKQQEQTKKSAEEAARKRDIEAKKRAEEAIRQLEETKRKEAPPPVPAVKPPPIPPIARHDDGRPIEELERELRDLEADIRKKEEQARKLEEHSTLSPEQRQQYEQELAKAWEDGALTPIEEEHLKELRMLMGITIQEHTRLTKKAQIDAYRSAFRAAWATGAISPERFSELADMRKRFHISTEESDQLEAEILWEARSGTQSATLLIVDDDVKLLNLVSDILREANYNVQAFTTSDEAFRFLKESTPDMIISDINLETSTMGGFTFYEKVREMDHLQNVPFIFLSGLTDEVLIRTGKELGVDDYLTKPFSDETLLATIKGKLKRFKKLSQSAKKK
ncbi:MAG TPA: response regulator [Bacteroidota bacterium]|nr:response regulator [Bacteroidota bacterium]